MSLWASPRSRKRKSVLAVTVAVSAMILTACAQQGGTGSDVAAGTSVPPGASEQDYQDALATMDPIVLNTQTTGAKGASSSRRFVSYLDSVTEWSGGKIKFNISYSNAIASPTDTDDALADGRLDIAQMVPQYEPSKYPAFNAFTTLARAGRSSTVVGLLQTQAWMMDLAYRTPQISHEFEQNGMKLLLPVFTSGTQMLFCSNPRRSSPSLHGAVVGVGSKAQSKQITALGARGVSVPYNEQYQSLQRGVIDCTFGPLLVGDLVGIIPAAPHVTSSPDVGFGYGLGALAMSSSVWKELPVAARQLMFSRLVVFVKKDIQTVLDADTSAVKDIYRAGGEIAPLSDGAANVLRKKTDKLLKDAAQGSGLGDDIVNKAKSTAKKWLDIVSKQLGYHDVPMNRFVDWYNSGKFDPQPYLEQVSKNILDSNRPS